MSDFSLEPMVPRPLTAAEAPSTRMHQGIPSITRLPSGRLFAVYYGGEIKGEGPGNYVVLCTSNDSGLTWKEVQVVAPDGRETTERAFDSEIWVAPAGALWWFWAQSCSSQIGLIFDGRSGVWCVRCESPDTDSPVWSAPRRIGDGIMMCKPIVLDDGTWALPASVWAYLKECIREKLPKELLNLQGANVLLSHDAGKTFERIQGPRVADVRPDAAIFDEHMIVQRKDGSLWMLIRTLDGIWQSESFDRGRTWSVPSPTAFGKTCSRFCIMRLRSGKLMFVHHQARVNIPGDKIDLWKRDYLTAWISDDDGRNWHGRLCLDERLGVSYPSAVQAEDGFIYVIYDHDRVRAGQVLLARFKEEDLEAGEFLTPGSYRQLLVNSFGVVR